MNLSLTLISLSILAMATPALAADAPSGDNGPSAVCKQLVDAAKKDDFDAFKKLSRAHDESHEKAREKMAQGKFHKMHHGAYLEKLKNINCGTDLIADDHAVVMADSEGKKRLIPFVKEADGWKFDARTYMVFYFAGMHHGHMHDQMKEGK